MEPAQEGMGSTWGLHGVYMGSTFSQPCMNVCKLPSFFVACNRIILTILNSLFNTYIINNI